MVEIQNCDIRMSVICTRTPDCIYIERRASISRALRFAVGGWVSCRVKDDCGGEGGGRIGASPCQRTAPRRRLLC